MASIFGATKVPFILHLSIGELSGFKISDQKENTNILNFNDLMMSLKPLS